MRKPRNYDSELKARDEKVRLFKERKVQQLGELVAATGAGTMPVEQLAGALLSAVDSKDLAVKEGWRTRGAAFFQGSRGTGGRTREAARGAQANDGGASSAASPDRS
jgi:hypothetical protein